MSINSISPLTPLKTDKPEYKQYNDFVNEYNNRVNSFNKQLNNIKSKKLSPVLRTAYAKQMNLAKNNIIQFRRNSINKYIDELQKESKKYNVFSKTRKNINNQIKLFENLKSVKESFISSSSVIPLIISILRIIILILCIMIFYKCFNLLSSPSSPSFPIH